jgi:hypothetical protein
VLLSDLVAGAHCSKWGSHKAAVTKALEEFIARRKQKRLLDLMGKLEWDEFFDYKAERSRR